MKFTFFSLIIAFITISTYAQVKLPVKNPVKINRSIQPMMVSPGISYDPVIIRNEIDSLLNKLIEKYVTMPNSTATWVSIKNEASGLMLQYFRSGQLFGNNPEESFYIQMDASTMTAYDLLNRKMILLAGIALYKPAEFVAIRVEKKNVAN